ncbi:MAG: NADH-quinone oxidoreductase subunit N [Acidimicrobiia bacterium]|nr:NADH-quinone oxidoreductase subunit N [Acidimicrobiia bacterium]
MLFAQVIDTPDVDVQILLPMIFMALGGLLILTMSSVKKDIPAWFITGWTVIASLGSIVAVISLWDRYIDEGPSSTIANAVGFDGFSLFLTVVIAASVMMSSLLAHTYLVREDLEGVELHVLLLLAGTGGVIMAFSNDLLVFFLGLETLSMAVYILAAMHRRRFESQEAGMKYFVLGAFSSTFLLYGIALVYGATGTTNLSEIQQFLQTQFLIDDGLLLGGVALMIVGLAFKVGAAPFHSWTPDVYQGAPTPVVAFMASGVKAAGFAGLLRILSVAFQPVVDDWGPPLEVIAALTLIIGSFSAIVQTDVKRMLAYSSISHAGFILLGVIAASDRGTAAALFYLATYAFLVCGTFGVLTVLGGEGDQDFSFESFKGLGRRKPLLSFALMVFLLAQAGVPVTSGFFAKFEVIAAAVDAGSYWVAIVAMLAAVVGAFLYIRVLISMYLQEPDEDAATLVIPRTIGAVIAAAVVVTVLFGVAPGLLDDIAQDAVAELNVALTFEF